MIGRCCGLRNETDFSSIKILLLEGLSRQLMSVMEALHKLD